jgi:hypothetical protein
VLVDGEDMARCICEESQQNTKDAMIKETKTACFTGLTITREKDYDYLLLFKFNSSVTPPGGKMAEHKHLTSNNDKITFLLNQIKALKEDKEYAIIFFTSLNLEEGNDFVFCGV